MNNGKRYSRSGFTLLEVMVVLTIMGVITTIGTVAFFRMNDYWNNLQENMRLNKIAGNAFDIFRKDFENVLSVQAFDMPLQGVHSDNEENVHFWQISLEDDSITFPVEIFNLFEQESERLWVNYSIDRESDSPRLVRKIMPYENKEGKVIITAVLEDIAGMRIRYFDGESWQDKWDAFALPKLVCVSISLVDYDKTGRQLARVATFAVPVQ